MPLSENGEESERGLHLSSTLECLKESVWQNLEVRSKRGGQNVKR